MGLSSMLDWPAPISPSAEMRSPARTTMVSPGTRSSTGTSISSVVAEDAGAAGKLFDKAVDGGLGAPGGVGFQALAQQHDEHGLGRGQVFAHRQRCHGRHADRQVGRNALFEELADGAVEGLVARQQGQEDGRVDAEDLAEQAASH